MTGRDGRLTIEGDRAVLTFERRLPYPIETVWSAITDPSHRNQWMGETTIDAREGGMIEMVRDRSATAARAEADDRTHSGVGPAARV